jgi:hypothetical protein
MDVFHRLPSELFFEIALHLPLTNDVLAFSLTTTRVRGALSTPALFKARLSLRGWDVSAWEDEDDIAQSPGDLMRWTCIDYTYCWIIQLFEEAAVDGYFPVTPNRPTRPESPDPGQGNPSPNLRPVFGGLGNKTAIWLEKLSKVLPLFVTHHRTHLGCIYDIYLNCFLCFLQAEETSHGSPKQSIDMSCVPIRGPWVTLVSSSSQYIHSILRRTLFPG